MTDERLEPDRTYLLDVLRDLIGFKTVAPPGSFYREIMEYLASHFEVLGLDVQKIVIPEETFAAQCSDTRLVGERVNIIAELDSGREKTLSIYTHVDVVPAGDGWATDPFRLTEKDGRVYGRGVSDSKGAVACLIAALKALLASSRPKYNLRIYITTDEEVGGYSGLCFLTDQNMVKGDYMLCMDGFSDDVVIGSNGIVTWEVRVLGRSAHSGSSFLGVNAVEKSIPVMEALMELKGQIQSRRSTLSGSSALGAMGVKNLMPMLNITMINGGIKENIVPDVCTLRGDRRVIPEESMEGAMEELEGVLKLVEVEKEVRFFPGYPPMRINPDHPWVDEVRSAVQSVTGRLPGLSGSQGSLDQAYATDKTGVPTCVFGVGRQMESNIHGCDENVRLDDIDAYARFLIALMAP